MICFSSLFPEQVVLLKGTKSTFQKHWSYHFPTPQPSLIQFLSVVVIIVYHQHRHYSQWGVLCQALGWVHFKCVTYLIPTQLYMVGLLFFSLLLNWCLNLGLPNPQRRPQVKDCLTVADFSHPCSVYSPLCNCVLSVESVSPSPWIWAGHVTCSDLENAVEMVLLRCRV